MLLQTNSYIVPKERRAEHARLLRRFRQVLMRLGCDLFEVYEQMGPNWTTGDGSGRFVQIMRFRDRKHQREVHASEQSDPAAQQLIAEFCDLVNLPYQQQQGLLAIGYYQGVMDVPASAILKQSTPGTVPSIPPQSPNPALRKRIEPKPKAAFGFGVPAAAAAAVAPAAAIGFGGAAIDAQSGDVPEDEPREEETDESASETWTTEAENEATAEHADESVELAQDLPLEEVQEDLIPSVSAVAAIAPAVETEPEEPELSGLDFSEEPTETAFAASPEELAAEEGDPGAAVSPADAEDNAEAILDGLDFSDLTPMESSGLDTFALDSLDADDASAGDAIGSLETDLEAEATTDIDAELDSTLEKSDEPQAQSAYAPHESQEAVGFNLIPEVSAEEAFHEPEVEVETPADDVAEVETALSPEPGLDFAPEGSKPDEEGWSPAAMEPGLAVEAPTAAEQSAEPAEGEFDLESVLAMSGDVESAETPTEEIGQSPDSETVQAAESAEFSIPEPATDELSTDDMAADEVAAAEPAEAEMSDRMFGLEPEPTTAEQAIDPIGDEVMSPAAEAPAQTDFSADAAFAIPPAASIEPVAAINGEHQHLSADDFESADVPELPMHLVTDEGEIEILYEEFPEDFQEDAEAPEAGGDDEIEAALNEALRE